MLEHWRLVPGHELKLLLHEVVVVLRIGLCVLILEVGMGSNFHLLGWISHGDGSYMLTFELVGWDEVTHVFLVLLVLSKHGSGLAGMSLCLDSV